MDKPYSLKIIDTTQDFLNVINESALPLGVIKLILQNIQSDLDNQIGVEIMNYNYRKSNGGDTDENVS